MSGKFSGSVAEQAKTSRREKRSPLAELTGIEWAEHWR